MRTLDYIAGLTFVTALMAFLFSFFTFNRYPIRSALMFGIALLIFFCACDTSQEIAQAQVLERLESMTEHYQISINSEAPAKPAEALSVLKELKWIPDHHSHPTKRINVEIFDGSRQIALSLARDSSDPREYWVFYPKFFITRYDEIGRIVTPEFDKY